MKSAKTFSWTQEAEEALNEALQRNLTATQIALEMSEKFGFQLTRCSVLGRVHRTRLKLQSKRADTLKRSKPPAQKPKAKAIRNGGVAPSKLVPIKPFVERAPEIVIPESQRVTLMELSAGMCRWPMGDPRTPEFRYCGGAACSGLPYCEAHARIGYTTPADRRAALSDHHKALIRYAALKRGTSGYHKKGAAK